MKEQINFSDSDPKGDFGFRRTNEFPLSKTTTKRFFRGFDKITGI